ncbi:MAG: hypothetical protein AUH81_02530 [Candidatus Rokubacteria bacterium 13_1_40CM_4_69_5]|nr:MAG: hypothetical protein AUH81_02530 [Candidatus Rokubacteria bacterium 13_1_40CM_4_69_5]
MSAHPLAGDFSVEASAQRVRHYRYAEERLMRTLGGWIALTPELPVKLLFGRHVWDCAQHADLWGRRLPELRSPAQQSEPANERFVRFMDLLDAREGRGESPQRVVGVYRVLKPHLVATYERHLAAANPLYEPPTRRILERCIAEERRHVAAGAAVLERLLRDDDSRARAATWERRLYEALAEAGGVTGESPTPPLAVDVAGVDPADDLVALDSVFDAGVIATDLRAEVDAHARALVEDDLPALAGQIAESARVTVLATYEDLGPAGRCDVVAQARVGAHRFVKLRLSGPRGATVLQLQWRRLDGPSPRRSVPEGARRQPR